MSTACQRSKEVESTTVGVCQWEERQRAATLTEVVVTILGINHLHSIYDVTRKVVYSKHNTLR